MTKTICITSMSQQYYDHVGKACIETFSQFWPRDITLYVYNENIENPKKKSRVEFIPWSVLEADYNKFVSRTENAGAIKFAKKGYSIIHAMKNLRCDRLIWIDADTYTTKPIHPQLISLLNPSDALSSHFGVLHNWPSEQDPDRLSFSCETGFFILNKTHTLFQNFCSRYEQYYQLDLGYALRRFYDGEVYGAVLKEMISNGAKVVELNLDQTTKTPIPRSILGEYLIHMKASAKDNRTNNDILKSLNLKESN